MNAKARYSTKQQRELIGFMQSEPGRHFTAAEICAYFRSQGKTIGTATVYRHLERMVDEGLVNKYIIDGNSPACFEYVGGEVHRESETCFHCKCEQCGKLIHLHCEELSEIGDHLARQHGFYLNPMRTVFYGLCAECADKEGYRPITRIVP